MTRQIYILGLAIALVGCGGGGSATTVTSGDTRTYTAVDGRENRTMILDNRGQCAMIEDETDVSDGAVMGQYIETDTRLIIGGGARGQAIVMTRKGSDYHWVKSAREVVFKPAE